jgi:hypothetical protein
MKNFYKKKFKALKENYKKIKKIILIIKKNINKINKLYNNKIKN